MSPFAKFSAGRHRRDGSLQAGRFLLGPALFWAIFLCEGAAPLHAQERIERPFQWTHELHAGTRLDLPDLPVTFVAPVDLVFRFWWESNELRLEARSYGDETFMISIVGLRNLRLRKLSELKPILEKECNGRIQPLSETPDSIVLRCTEEKTALRPAQVLLFRLEHIPGAPADARLNQKEVPDRFFLISAATLPENQSWLDRLGIQRKTQAGHPGRSP